MATVNTTINMVPSYQPFERPPDPVALWTAIPRGLRGFVVQSDDLDAKPVNDTQVLTFLAELPAGFGYVFAEVGLRLSQNRAADWDKKFQLNLQNFHQGKTISISYMYTLALTALGSELGVTLQSTDKMPKSVLWAPAGASIEIQIIMINTNATVAAAGSVACFIDFWEFDLEQIRKFPINTPLPIHSR